MTSSYSPPSPAAGAADAAAGPADPVNPGAAPPVAPPAKTTPNLHRFYTRPGEDPLETVDWTRRVSRILDPDGSVVFEMEDAEVPAGWSQLATDIMASKYFRKAGVPETGYERSAREVVTRVARTMRQAGEELGGYFSDPDEAQTFEDELAYMLVHQIGAFNSPVWFNCGLAQYHGIKGRPVGNWYWNAATGKLTLTTDSYTHPQLSACFIQSIDDDLLDIAEAVRREMQLFKFGSGTGTNFSTLRAEGEQLSGGGTSSGLMSFLEILDRAAGATKSGGTTRRAAKMVILDMDHPDIEAFIQWKAREEDKALTLIRAGYDADFNGEAYRTVSGQNSNNSVRIPDSFMHSAIEDREWATTWRTTGEVAKVYRARELLDMVAQAAWRCADPGVQFDSTINRWHTCKNTARINASNPCAEYMFLDNSACNLSSLNLMRFVGPGGAFDVTAYRHAIEVFVTAMDIIVDLASYPTREITSRSHDYRPLGLGYANLGALLMVNGLPYDSEEGRNLAATLAAVLCGHAYATSATIAATKGPFNDFAHNRECMLEVIGMHRDHAYRIGQQGVPDDLLQAARSAWDLALEQGRRHGFRNAQATVIAPTGTIGLLMDCDTTGIEPDFALVKFKKLAGGGYFKIINQSVPAALAQLGYDEAQVEAILRHVIGTQSFGAARHLEREKLLDRGLTAGEVTQADAALPGVFELSQAFSPQVIGEAVCHRLGLPAETSGRTILGALGYTAREIEEDELVLCGHLTIEGAPHLRPEHRPIFDCANRSGRRGQRCIHYEGHIRMMAAVQPFISGAISKTINMPAEVSADDIKNAYHAAWQSGLKAIALYRDGCKGSQPLAASAGTARAASEEEAEEASAVQAGNVEQDSGGGDSERAAAAGGATIETPAARAAGNGRRTPAAGGVPAATMTAGAVAEGSSPAAGPGATALRPAQDRVLQRRRLPKKRSGFTQEARVGGNKLYLRTGEYPDGRLGEIFIDMHKEGAAFRSMMNCFAIAVSLGLQHGVPLEEYVDAFVFTRFDPQGPVDHPNIKYATSVIDYIFRVLGMEYQGRTDFVQVKPADQDADEARAIEGLEAETARPPSGGDGELHATAVPEAKRGAARNPDDSLSEQLRRFAGDAPFCDTCGHLTVRNGACYRCLNCGNSMGCS